MKNAFRLFLLVLALQAGWPTHLLAQPFAKGADVSWVTEMEAAGRRFYTPAGVQQDLFQILHDSDLNAIRLRVWVNPAGGWNGKNDVVTKAIRAHNLGFRLMIDFHYSDTWADPGHQTKPAAWQNLTFNQLKVALYNHTYAVLDTLRSQGIVPEWVQVGNETNDGMLWPDGRRSTNPQNFAALVDQGYAAVKAVDPTSKVIVHISNGYNNASFRNVFDGLAVYGARYDVIGMSHYPTTANWPTLNAQIQTNMSDMVSRYPGKQVMVVETGMPLNSPIPTRQMLVELMSKVQAVPGNRGLGVLYWEPEAYNWQNYGLGAWSANGQPGPALAAFHSPPPSDGLVYNPGFEYTAATQVPLGWSTDAPTDPDADFTQNYGRASLFQLAHRKASAYQVRTYQLLPSVPNGTYTLKAWAQSTGGQSVCQLYATGFGGAEQHVNIPGTAGNWVQVQVPNVVVTNGRCEVGFRSVSGASDNSSFDDVEFALTSPTATALALPANALDVQVFPNPANQQFTLAFDLGQAETVQVSLCNLVGKVVAVVLPSQLLSSGPHRQVVQLDETLAPGMYLLQTRHNGLLKVQKIIKQ